VNFLSTYSDKKSCHTSITLQTSIARFVSDSWASCSLTRRNNFVGGACAPSSALLVLHVTLDLLTCLHFPIKHNIQMPLCRWIIRLGSVRLFRFVFLRVRTVTISEWKKLRSVSVPVPHVRAGRFNWPISSDHVLVVVWRHFRGVSSDAGPPHSTRWSMNDKLSLPTCRASLKSPIVTILTCVYYCKNTESLILMSLFRIRLDVFTNTAAAS